MFMYDISRSNLHQCQPKISKKTEREIGTTLNLTISGENQLFVITENDGLLDFRLPATLVDCRSLTMV